MAKPENIYTEYEQPWTHIYTDYKKQEGVVRVKFSIHPKGGKRKKVSFLARR